MLLHSTSGEFAGLLTAQANPVSVLLKPDAPASDARAVRTWAGVMAIVGASASPVVVWIDCTTSGPYAIPAGKYDLRRAFLVGVKFGNPDENKLLAPEGVILVNLGGLAGSVSLDMSPTTVAPLAFDVVSPAQPPVLGLLLGPVLKNSGTRALADVTGTPGLILALVVGGSVDSGSTAPIMALAPGAAGLLSNFAPGGNPGNIVSGGPGTTLQVIGSSAPQTPPSIGFTGTLSYGPNNSAWFGPTSQRPAFAAGDCPGFPYFDSSLGKPIWWIGSGWCDATGAPV